MQNQAIITKIWNLWNRSVEATSLSRLARKCPKRWKFGKLGPCYFEILRVGKNVKAPSLKIHSRDRLCNTCSLHARAPHSPSRPTKRKVPLRRDTESVGPNTAKVTQRCGGGTWQSGCRKPTCVWQKVDGTRLITNNWRRISTIMISATSPAMPTWPLWIN